MNFAPVIFRFLQQFQLFKSQTSHDALGCTPLCRFSCCSAECFTPFTACALTPWGKIQRDGISLAEYLLFFFFFLNSIYKRATLTWASQRVWGAAADSHTYIFWKAVSLKLKKKNQLTSCNAISFKAEKSRWVQHKKGVAGDLHWISSHATQRTASSWGLEMSNNYLPSEKNDVVLPRH